MTQPSDLGAPEPLEYRTIEAAVDLTDPEAGFSFRSARDVVELSYVDWTNRRITFRFHSTYVFSHRIASGWRSLPEARVLEILDSSQVQSLRDDSSASASEELHHFVISTNEDEWCEIIAERFDIAREPEG